MTNNPNELTIENSVRVSNIESQRGATTSALVFDWIMAQVKAGVVSSPDVVSTPVSAGSR